MKEAVFEIDTEIIDTSSTEQLLILNSELSDVSSIEHTSTAQFPILPSTLEIPYSEKNEQKNNTEEGVAKKYTYILSHIPVLSEFLASSLVQNKSSISQCMSLPNTLKNVVNGTEENNITNEVVAETNMFRLNAQQMSLSSTVQASSISSNVLSDTSTTQSTILPSTPFKKKILLTDSDLSPSSSISDISTSENTTSPTIPSKRKKILSDCLLL